MPLVHGVRHGPEKVLQDHDGPLLNFGDGGLVHRVAGALLADHGEGGRPVYAVLVYRSLDKDPVRVDEVVDGLVDPEKEERESSLTLSSSKNWLSNDFFLVLVLVLVFFFLL